MKRLIHLDRIAATTRRQPPKSLHPGFLCQQGYQPSPNQAKRRNGSITLFLMMGNHGVLVVAPTVARAMDEMYYFEKSCETLMIAYATGRPLRIAPDHVAENTARQWEDYGQFAIDHLREVRAILDAEEPDYRD